MMTEIKKWLQYVRQAEESYSAGDFAGADRMYALAISLLEAELVAGGTVPSVRVVALQLASNAGYNPSKTGRHDSAEQYSQRGLEWAEAFLAAGETGAEVRRYALQLASNAGANAYETGRPDSAEQYFQRGLGWAEAFLAAGEFAPEVRERALKLALNAGAFAYETGRPDSAEQYFQRGLGWAEAFLAAGETAPGVRKVALELASNASANAEKTGRPDSAEQYYQRGLDWAEAFLAAGETAPEVREAALMMAFNAGISAENTGRHDSAEQYYQRGLDWAKEFFAAGEFAPRVREQALKLASNAGVNSRETGRNDSAEQYYQRGLDWAEAFLAAGETAPEVRENALRLAYSTSTNAFDRALIAQTRLYLVHVFLLRNRFRWPIEDRVWLYTTHNTQIIFKAAPPNATHRVFESTLHLMLSRYLYPQQPEFTPDTRFLCLELAHSLWALRHARFNHGYRSELKAAFTVLQTLAERAAKERRLTREIKDLNAGLFEPVPHDLATFQSRKAKLSWFTRLRYPFRIARLEAGLKRIKSLQVISRDEQKQIDALEKRCAAWTAEGWMQTLPDVPSLEAPEAFVLALLFMGACGSKRAEDRHGALFSAWREQKPWRDPQNRQVLLNAIHWERWRERPEATLAVWLDALGLDGFINYPVLANQPNAPLLARVLAFAKGDDDLVQHLDRLIESAHIIAGQLYAALEPEFFPRPRPPEAHSTAILAAAILMGAVPSLLARWLLENLPAWPADGGPDAYYRNAQHRFARLLHRHPAPLWDQPLALAVHRFADAVLKDAAAANQLYRIWEALETARLALTSAAVSLPDDSHWERTGVELKEALLAELNPSTATHPGWNALSVWRQAMQAVRLEIPTPEAVQARLSGGEALAQLYFTQDGALEALWLTAESPLKQLALCADAALSRWDEPLTLWNAWLRPRAADKSDTPIDLSQDWLAVLARQPAVSALAGTLRDWFKTQDKIILFLPAKLAQLPWESLIDWQAPQSRQTNGKAKSPIMERGVTLTHWRKAQVTRSTAKSALLADDNTLSAFSRLEAHYSGKMKGVQFEEAPGVVALLKSLSSDNGLTHLVAHSQLNLADPWRSSLSVSRKEPELPAWALPGAGVQGELMLSACEVLRHGVAVQDDLLGTVGIGPALIAAGAKRVSGPLWVCDPVAALFFSYYRLNLHKTKPGLMAFEIQEQARAKLRNATSRELQHEFTKHIAPGENLVEKVKISFLEPASPLLPDLSKPEARPFSHPFYHAGFATLGEAG